MVAAACDHVTGRTAGQFAQIGFCHVRQLKAELAAKLGHIPEHISELQLQRFRHGRGELTCLIPQHLLHLVSHLTSFTTEAEGGINRIRPHIGIAGCQACTLLIGIEIHWQSRVGGPR